MAHMRRGNVDLRMGTVLVIGGLAGSVLGVWLFAPLRRLGLIDLAISLAYVVLIGTVGALMLVESVRAWLRVRARRDTFAKRHPAPLAACRSGSGFTARGSTSARSCRSASGSWPASWSRSWGSGAVSCWCPQ
jgi:uncharacterized membrane protein YfcA